MNHNPSDRFYIQVPDQRWFEENIGCENACPVNTRAPQYISAIRKEDCNLAFELNRGDNLFPAILGRICVHPCEEKCRRGLLIDLPISICSLKRACADHKTPSTRTETAHQQTGEKGGHYRSRPLRTLRSQRSCTAGICTHDLRDISHSGRDAQCRNPSVQTSPGSCASGH